MEVTCYKLGEIADEQLSYAVIVTQLDGKYVFVKHRQRETLEIPGGHRESGETIADCAKRELFEETGATKFSLEPIFIYGVKKDEEDFGTVFFADIFERESELSFEIDEIYLLEEEPEQWTYPGIQPILFNHFLSLKNTN